MQQKTALFAVLIFVSISLGLSAGSENDDVEVLVGDGPAYGSLDGMMFVADYLVGFSGKQFWIWLKREATLYAQIDHSSAILMMAIESPDSALFVDRQGGINRLRISDVKIEKTSNGYYPKLFVVGGSADRPDDYGPRSTFQIVGTENDEEILANTDEGLFRISKKSPSAIKILTWTKILANKTRNTHGILLEDRRTVLTRTNAGRFVMVNLEDNSQSPPAADFRIAKIPGLTNEALQGARRSKVGNWLTEYCELFSASQCPKDFGNRTVSGNLLYATDVNGEDTVVRNLASGATISKIFESPWNHGFKLFAIDDEGAYIAAEKRVSNLMWAYSGIEIVEIQSKKVRRLGAEEAFVMDVDISDDGVLVAAGSVPRADAEDLEENSLFIASWNPREQIGNTILDCSEADNQDSDANAVDEGSPNWCSFATQVRWGPGKSRIAVDGYGYTLSLALDEKQKMTGVIANYDHCNACRINFDNSGQLMWAMDTIGGTKFSLTDQKNEELSKGAGKRELIEENRKIEKFPANLREYVTRHGHPAAVIQKSAGLGAIANGRVFLWNLQRDEFIGELILFKDGSWVFVTNEGYFSADNRALRSIKFRHNKQIHDVDRFKETFHRPDLVNRKMQGQN